MKKLIRLTEGDLHRIVEGSVRRALNELDWKTYMNAAKKSYDRWKNDNDDDEAADRVDNFTGAAKDSFMKKHSALDYHTPRHINPQWGEIEAFGGRDHKFNANFSYPDYDNDNNTDRPKATANIIDYYMNDSENHPPYKFNNVKYHSEPGIRRGVQVDDYDVPRTKTTLNNRDYPDAWDDLGDAYNDINHYNTGKSKYRKGKGWED